MVMSDDFFLEPAVSTGSIEAYRLDHCTDAELDKLAYGVIALDAEGIVLRYNQYESRLARLDRNQVLGQSFFRDVAPCTQSAEFEGRFNEYVQGGSRSPIRFPYLFDFRFGAQQVMVELVRPSDLDRYYLLINRTEFRPARVDGIPAPLQAELAPGEGRLGVRRGGGERRMVEVSSLFFAGLKATCSRLAPQTWPTFCYEWGVEWGRRAAIDLEAHHLEAEEKGLRELPMRRVAELLDAWFLAQGLGHLTLDFGFSKDGCLLLELQRSALAEAAARPVRPEPGEAPRACSLLAGCLSALLGHVGNRRLVVREIGCSAGGQPLCSFVAVAPSRAQPLDEMLATGGTKSAADVVQALLQRRGGSVERR